MWHICNRYQEQISKKYWAETKSCQLTLLRTWSYSYLTNSFKGTVYSGWKTSYQYSDMHKVLHHCFLFQFHLHWFFNKHKLDFCSNSSTVVVYLGATHKHNPVCQPQGVFKSVQKMLHFFCKDHLWESRQTLRENKSEHPLVSSSTFPFFGIKINMALG